MTLRHLLLILLTISYPSVAKTTFNLAVTIDWKPYLYVNDQGKADGEDLALLTRVLDRIGYQLNTENLPEQRMALEIEQGQSDVILGAAYTESRAEHNYYSVPYRKETIVFGFRMSRHPEFLDADVAALLSLDYLITLNKSGWFGETFKRTALQNHESKLIHAEGTLRRMQLLSMNRVDAIIGDKKVLQAAASELQIDDFNLARQVIHQTNVHFLFSRSRVDEAFMARFNRALLEEQSTQALFIE